MEILSGIIIEDVFLYLKKYKTFIISDIHTGYEESLHRHGYLIPKSKFGDLKLRLNKAISKILKIGKIETVIINGDILHEFSKIKRKEKEQLEETILFLSEFGKVRIIKGNHDKILSYLIKDIVIVDSIMLGDILITHGDIIQKISSDKKIKTIIIGHEHPAIALTHNARVEKYKCFLKGKYKGKNLIAMPSSNFLVEGTDVLTGKLLSPYLQKKLDFEVYIIEDKVYPFGKIKNLMG